jgi:glycosyltransferase involved in cell wall biosynthesis
MKILFVTEQFPYPLDNGGNIRTFHILRQLAKEHEVILASCERSGLSSSDYDELKPYCSEIKLFPPVPRETLRQGYYLIESLFGGRPYPINRNYSKEIHQWIRQRVGEVDVIHFNHLDAVCYAEDFEGVFVFDTHNLISNIYLRMRDQESNPLKRWFLRVLQKKTFDYEARIIGRIALCLACSDNEKAEIENLVPGIRTETIPNGVDTGFYTVDAARTFNSADHNLIFLGAMDYLPNFDGIRFFCKEVFDILQKHLPDIQLTIIGRNPPESIERLEKENLTVTGFVEDVRQWIQRADLMVVPIRIGGGTRIKILEGMAQGIPVISTRIGAEGIQADHEENIFFADTSQEMIEGIIKLLKDPDLRKKIADGGRKLVEEKYDWNVSGKKLLAAYSSIH